MGLTGEAQMRLSVVMGSAETHPDLASSRLEPAGFAPSLREGKHLDTAREVSHLSRNATSGGGRATLRVASAQPGGGRERYEFLGSHFVAPLMSSCEATAKQSEGGRSR